MTKLVAVLSGDVIGSVGIKAASGRPVHEMLREAAGAANEAFPDARLSAIDIFRGDSWQCLVPVVTQALAAAVFLRAYLRGHGPTREPYHDTRIAIGIGGVDRVVAERISQSGGSAFVTSGRALDALKKERMTLRVADRPARPEEAAVLALLDAVVSGWSDKQALAVAGRLRGWTQERIGQSFDPPVKQHTAGEHLHKASWDAVERAIAWFEEVWAVSDGNRP